MLKTFFMCLVLVAVSMVLLCVNLLLKKNGRFVKTHVSQSKEMRKRGVTCVQSQDRAARMRNPHAIKERS